MKIGDEVIISDKNSNHLGYGVCAYTGMKGTVKEIWKDNGFYLDCGNCSLVVPMVIYGAPKTIWIWVNGELIKYKGIRQCLKEKLNNQDIHGNLIQKYWGKIRATLKESWFRTSKSLTSGSNL